MSEPVLQEERSGVTRVRTPANTEGKSRRLMTDVEVATEFGLNLQSMRADRYRRRGLPFVKIGRKVMYVRESIERFLTANEVWPAPTCRPPHA